MKKKRFIISSSIELLVPKYDQDLIFLGDWCFTNLNRKKFAQKKIKILDYHWNNSNKLEKDYKYLNKIYKILSKNLAEFLNLTHKKNFSIKYWEQIFGIWLLRFIIFVYDKYSTVKKISKKQKYFYNFINLDKKFIPNTSSEANYLFQNEYYNHKIFSKILFKLRPKISFIEKRDKSIKSKFSNPKINFSYILRSLSFLSNFKKIKNEIFIIHSYLSFYKEILLQLFFNGFPKINYCEKISKKFLIIHKIRKKNLKNKTKDPFLKLISELIIKNIPASYLEGYDFLKRKTIKYNWPTNPKAVLTANAHFNFDVFKFWLADKREKNVKLIVSQHGAGYLFSKFHSDYDLDINNCNYFLSWGKKNFLDKKILPGFNLRLKKKFKQVKKENILFIQHFPYKYTTRLVINDHNFSNIISNLDNQKKIINELNKNITNPIKIRLFSSKNFYPDIHNYEKDKWGDYLDKHIFETRDVPIENSISNSKIVIINTLHSTLFFECLSSNIPCFIFSNFSLKHIKKECRKDFLNLKNVGIIQNNPLDFANFLNKNIQNIDTWWNGKKISYIKNNFITNYCFYEKSPIKSISKNLNKIKL